MELGGKEVGVGAGQGERKAGVRAKQDPKEIQMSAPAERLLLFLRKSQKREQDQPPPLIRMMKF